MPPASGRKVGLAVREVNCSSVKATPTSTFSVSQLAVPRLTLKVPVSGKRSLSPVRDTLLWYTFMVSGRVASIFFFRSYTVAPLQNV